MRPHVVDVIGSDATAELNARMPKGVQTFGNACRVIPAGADWVKHGGVKLFWGWTMGDRGRITDAVLQEAARLSFSNSYSTNMAAGSKRAVSGTVMGSPAEGRVLVSLGRGLYATILTTLVTKDVPGDRLFTKGMAVTGLFDEDSRRLDLTAPRPREAREALSGYASGMVVPARVTAVRRDSCTLELFPGAVVEVAAEDAGLGADLRWELTVGAVVPVAVIERDDGEDAWSDVDAKGNVRLHWLMSLLDADGTVSPAPSYFPGGPAWIAIPDASEAAVRQPEQRELATVDERQLAALIPRQRRHRVGPAHPRPVRPARADSAGARGRGTPARRHRSAARAGQAARAGAAAQHAAAVQAPERGWRGPAGALRRPAPAARLRGVYGVGDAHPGRGEGGQAAQAGLGVRARLLREPGGGAGRGPREGGACDARGGARARPRAGQPRPAPAAHRRGRRRPQAPHGRR